GHPRRDRPPLPQLADGLSRWVRETPGQASQFPDCPLAAGFVASTYSPMPEVPRQDPADKALDPDRRCPVCTVGVAYAVTVLVGQGPTIIRLRCYDCAHEWSIETEPPFFR